MIQYATAPAPSGRAPPNIGGAPSRTLRSYKWDFGANVTFI